jgi:hypothetical protein
VESIRQEFGVMRTVMLVSLMHIGRELELPHDEAMELMRIPEDQEMDPVTAQALRSHLRQHLADNPGPVRPTSRFY